MADVRVRSRRDILQSEAHVDQLSDRIEGHGALHDSLAAPRQKLSSAKGIEPLLLAIIKKHIHFADDILQTHRGACG